MNIARSILPRLAVSAALLSLAAAPAAAQELYTFTVSALGGLGGSLDADPGDDLGNNGFQLNFSLVTEPKTHLGFRLGRVDLDQPEGFGSLNQAELTYLTVAGEYRTTQTFYQSGIYVGLGGYRLEGIHRLTGASEEDTSFGAVLGLTGEFEVTRHVGILVEVSGHWADLQEANVYLLGHLGVAFHF